MQQSETFDAIVVGSGISGGWAAKELTERGLRVLLLERGKNVEHGKDYANARKAPWEYPHRGGRSRDMIDAYPVLKRDYPLNEKNLDWWASDKDSPYTEVKRFDWYRGYQVGGRSLTWGRQSYRLSDWDFEANAKEGVAVDWPIRYADLAPWYDHVERHAGISGSIEGLPQLPDGQFQPAMPLNCAEEMIAGRLARQFEGRRRIIPGRTANLTQPLGRRGRCQYRAACWLGCPYGAYFSTQSSTLPPAVATGRLTLKPFSIVTEILYDRERQRATGVRVLDAVSEQTTEYTARVVFVCASTLNSTWLLMRSATDVWPEGLGSSSGELVHNLMDITSAGAKASSTSRRPELRQRPTGFYIPRPEILRRRRGIARFRYRAARAGAAGNAPCASSGSAEHSRIAPRSPASGRSAPRHSARFCRGTTTR
jgi:choline dehydrogenase-like flavoprotein